MIQAEQNNRIDVPGHVEGEMKTQDTRGAIFCRGLQSLLSILLAPLGRIVATYHQSLSCPRRMENGLIVILPGIEGCSSINESIARGLVAAELSHSIQIIDWRRFRPWNPLHLAMQRHNRTQARVVADLIIKYQRNFPGQPVHLIGHSAGAGMALFVLENLQENQAVTSVTLMAAAVSRRFDVTSLLSRTKAGIWNFYSPLDLPTVGLGTIIFGTMDRRHSISAGALGFITSDSNSLSNTCDSKAMPKLHQIGFQKSMARSWNFGGHFGPTNAVFVQNNIAPICRLR